jgi:hypothetical protein
MHTRKSRKLAGLVLDHEQYDRFVQRVNDLVSDFHLTDFLHGYDGVDRRAIRDCAVAASWTRPLAYLSEAGNRRPFCATWQGRRRSD